MGEAGPGCRAPGDVARGERLAHLRWQPLAAHPGRVSRHQVEPAAREQVGEVRLEREERGAALAPQPACSPAELPAARPEATEPSLLVRRESTPPAEQVAVLRRSEEHTSELQS